MIECVKVDDGARAAGGQSCRHDAPLAGRRILLVEDAVSTRMITAAMLGAAGARVTEAPGGVEALDLIVRDEFDVVVTDIDLPDIRGDDLTPALRAASMNPQLAIIAVSGEECGAALTAAGVDAFLQKPFSGKTELQDAVVALLGLPDGDQQSGLSNDVDGEIEIRADDITSSLVDDFGVATGRNIADLLRKDLSAGRKEISAVSANHDMDRLVRARHFLTGVAGFLNARRLLNLLGPLDPSAAAQPLDWAAVVRECDRLQQELSKVLTTMADLGRVTRSSSLGR